MFRNSVSLIHFSKFRQHFIRLLPVVTVEIAKPSHHVVCYYRNYH